MQWNPDDWDNIPKELQNIPQWMVCEGPKNKTPLTLSGYPGNPTDPHNWSTYSEAYRIAYQRHWWLGFCLSTDDPYTFIDMDNKDENPIYAKYIIDTCGQLDTYIERSINGKGVHAIIQGNIGPGRRLPPFEFYSHGRFMIMTGNVAKAAPISANYQYILDQVTAQCGQTNEPEQVLIDWTLTATQEELDQDNLCLGWFANRPDVANIERLFYGRDCENPEYRRRSEDDLALMQLYYQFNKGRPERERHTVRMFMRSPRAQYLTRKSDQQQYVARTLGRIKSWIDPEEIERPMLMNAANNFVAGSNVLPFPKQQFRPQLPAPQQKQFEFFGIDELLNRPPVKWVVKDMLQQGKTAILYGWSGVGKTFLILDLMEAIATGRRWFGFRTTPMPVRYFSLEGVEGLQQRVRAWEAMNQRAYPRDGNVAISETNLDLVRDRDALIDSVGALNGVIIIDTLAEALGGRSENKSEDMQPVTDAAKYIAGHTNSAVVVIHHSTKPDAKTGETTGYPRGWGGLYANFDADIEIGYKGAEDEPERFVYAEKVKDGHSKWTRNFTLIEQALGTDEYGDMIESLAVRYDAPVEQGVNQYGEVDRPWEGEKKDRRGRRKVTKESKAPMDGEKSERAFRTSLNEKTLLQGWGELKRVWGDPDGWVPLGAIEEYMLQHIAGGRVGTRRTTLNRVLEKLQGMGKLECKPDGKSGQFLRMVRGGA